jgi:mRNA interferase RelE/StbE
MNYKVALTPAAIKERERLPEEIRRRIDRILRTLVEESHPPNSRKLTGSQQDWRVRVGDYRILYEIEEEAKQIVVWRIAHRREAYRQ